jgi:hypothetical protein
LPMADGERTPQAGNSGLRNGARIIRTVSRADGISHTLGLQWRDSG